jgi:hypothetical protein
MVDSREAVPITYLIILRVVLTIDPNLIAFSYLLPYNAMAERGTEA